MPRQRKNELLFLSVTGRTISLSSKFFSCLFVFLEGVEGGTLHRRKKNDSNVITKSHHIVVETSESCSYKGPHGSFTPNHSSRNMKKEHAK